jgi:hypothetical protein
MIQQIQSIDDVKTFFNELLAEGLNFHPDDPFEYYINTETHQPTYTVDEAAQRTGLLDQAFDVCEKESADIYELCIEIFMADFYKAFPPEPDA